MTTAVWLARTLTEAFMLVRYEGQPRPVLAVEVVEPGIESPVEATDLVLGIGANDSAAALGLASRCAHSAGIVVRAEVADSPALREECRRVGVPLLALGPQTGWAAVAQAARSALEQALDLGGADGPEGAWTDLFGLAETCADILGAPVTIEDAHSRVLAWSQGQDAVDEARTSTIIGRQVPRSVRDHFRARGVFRHLATSDEPLLVRASSRVTKARWVLPVRGGGEWLGSVWAVLDGDRAPVRGPEARLLADAVAVRLLRRRARTELHRQVEVDQVRAVLRGEEPSPWMGRLERVAVLVGPDPELDASVRLHVWTALLRRHGWGNPLVADLDGQVLALVSSGTGAGSVGWLERFVTAEHGRDPGLWATLGPAPVPGTLADSCRAAIEQVSLGLEALGRPFTRPADCWAALGVRRALGVGGDDLDSPVRQLARQDPTLLATLTEHLRHRGDQRAAARALGVHVNTVHNRLTRIRQVTDLDLEDPTQRLAAWLDCERWARGEFRGPDHQAIE